MITSYYDGSVTPATPLAEGLLSASLPVRKHGNSVPGYCRKFLLAGPNLSAGTAWADSVKIQVRTAVQYSVYTLYRTLQHRLCGEVRVENHWMQRGYRNGTIFQGRLKSYIQ